MWLRKVVTAGVYFATGAWFCLPLICWTLPLRTSMVTCGSFLASRKEKMRIGLPLPTL